MTKHVFFYSLQRLHLFLVRFSRILDVAIKCNSCGATLLEDRSAAHCVICQNVDLCPDCFRGKNMNKDTKHYMLLVAGSRNNTFNVEGIEKGPDKSLT